MNEETTNKPTSNLKKIVRNSLIVLFSIMILSVVLLLGFLKWALATPLDNNPRKEIFEIKEGQSTQEIGNRLVTRKIIRTDWVFDLNAKFKNLSLKPGIYDLSSNMSIIEVSDKIAEGQTNVAKITIPEGYRREQIAQLLEKSKFNSEQFLKKTEGMEGYLFPDTYYFTPDNTIDEIVAAMRKDFDTKTADINLSKEDLIIASIVEREAIKDEERPIIAGIYKNRLKQNMKLEADPTVQFGKDTSSLASSGLADYKFWKPLVKGDYKNVVSGYNTYQIDALPPGPICNPGIASINATINYTDHAYLYFLQHDGQIYPSKTVAEHNAKVNQYLR